MSMPVSRWQEASYHPGQLGSDSYLIISVPSGRAHCYPDPCFSQARRGETPVMGDPQAVARMHVRWESSRQRFTRDFWVRWLEDNRDWVIAQNEKRGPGGYADTLDELREDPAALLRELMETYHA